MLNRILGTLLFSLLLSVIAHAQTDTSQSVTIEIQDSLQDQTDKVPASCQDLIEEIYRLRLNNEYLRNELNASIQQIDKMKIQVEQLLKLQTQLYQKLEQQFQQAEPEA